MSKITVSLHANHADLAEIVQYYKNLLHPDEIEFYLVNSSTFRSSPTKHFEREIKRLEEEKLIEPGRSCYHTCGCEPPDSKKKSLFGN